jgi:hypothetical protein
VARELLGRGYSNARPIAAGFNVMVDLNYFVLKP